MASSLTSESPFGENVNVAHRIATRLATVTLFGRFPNVAALHVDVAGLVIAGFFVVALGKHDLCDAFLEWPSLIKDRFDDEFAVAVYIAPFAIAQVSTFVAPPDVDSTQTLVK